MIKPPSRFRKFSWKVRGYIPFSNWWLIWKKLDKTSKSILDLGCGIGNPMRFINRHKQFYTVGIEGFKPYVDQCQQKKTHDLVLHGDIRNLPYKPKSFDVVLCIQVLEHLDKPDGKLLLRNMERIARKQVIIATDTSKFVQGALDGNELQVHRYIWSVEELQEQGFEVFGIGLKGYGGDTGFARFLPEIPRGVIALIFQLIMPFLYYYPKYAGAALCIKNLKK